jgi:hypothetical protein
MKRYRVEFLKQIAKYLDPSAYQLWPGWQLLRCCQTRPGRSPQPDCRMVDGPAQLTWRTQPPTVGFGDRISTREMKNYPYIFLYQNLDLIQQPVLDQETCRKNQTLIRSRNFLVLDLDWGQCLTRISGQTKEIKHGRKKLASTSKTQLEKITN